MKLFQAAGETYYNLYHIASYENIPVAPDRSSQIKCFNIVKNWIN